ncbi:sodium/hydrogen exchanger family protein [Sulfuritortus calidifontis]|uniref:Sodium/hydrogen exchanger family protein n=1 Tax=Sulfuritortus calidifontis TaxID=1914471 RepID=A0A4R3JUF9_9PROT|nr:cation:proton antiporter [Sulfuritortus calidifontis]TCS71459.1 sodium/hydrogen exchanger family protein [Sulfuritortus calidifontis]
MQDLFSFSFVLLVAGSLAAAVSARLRLPTLLGYLGADVVLGESDFRHRMEDDIRPFRDVLTSLFFITIGL